MKGRPFDCFILGFIIGGIFGGAIALAMAAGDSETIYDSCEGVSDTVFCDRSELTEWEIMQMAVIETESKFNTLAVGKSGDLGLYQITEVYVEEVNRILGEPVYSHTDAFNPAKSAAMFGIYQSYYNPDMDIEKAIRLHNPNGDCIGYSARVLGNMERIRKYETIRGCLIKK